MLDIPERPPSRLTDALIAVILVVGGGAPILLAVAGLLGWIMHPLVGTCGALATGIALASALYRRIRRDGRARFQIALEILVLVVLPLWGLAYSHFVGRPTCTVTSCDADTVAMRPLAEPEVYGLVALHAIIAVTYAISRRRPAALPPLAEAWVHASLLAGALVHAALAIHFGRWLGVALLIPPVFLPCAAPVITVVLYTAELTARLSRRGVEAATPPGAVSPDSPYRAGPLQDPLPAAPRVHRPALLRAFALAPVILGVHAVIHALWLGRPDGALAVVTRTCGHVLSTVPIEVIPQDCHYLCTVAARGHEWLVRPTRLGRRRGVTIVVNRQLALANAFEDLLHERWPRFGALARRVYDRIGLPVSRYLRRRWLADVVYLAMKPAEWAFYAALLLLDRGDPEARIDRMYRA